MSGADERSGSAREDDVLVAALGRASCAVAASEGRSGPPPSVWHSLVRRRAQRAVPAGLWRRRSRFWPVAAGLAVAVIAVVAVVRWGEGGRGGWSIGGLARHRTTAPTDGATSRSGAPLTFAVAGASLRSGDEIDAAGRSKAEIRFSDGTHIGLSEGARLAVADRSADGARLRLRGGRAHFQVVHRPRAAWTVDAGPYLIEVTGTVFDVRWSEVEQTIEVRMQSGSVRVSGPLLSGRTQLRTGQHLVARPVDGDVRIDQGRPDDRGASGESTGDDGEGATAAPEPAPTRGAAAEGGGGERRATAPVIDRAAAMPLRAGAPGTLSAVPRPATAPKRARVGVRLAFAREASALLTPTGEPVEPGRFDGSASWEAEPLPSLEAPERPAPAQVEDEAPARTPLGAMEGPPVAPTAHPEMSSNLWRQRRWSAKVAAGESQAVLADADVIGVEATLAGADSQSLAALADAARYAGRPELAEKALVEERRRFPGGVRAQAAAFLLGRAADDRGDIQGGLAWYRRYLIEAPTGPYAAEAVGREMLAIERLQGREAAVPLAADYLRRFPNGTYLLRARSLLHDR